jgi:molybdopterin/thiamine biosynthesis adenylyltransferase
MDDNSLLRYSRHILLDEIGIAGQERLAGAHALVVGAGGLGSPAVLYLASAGVGRITVADPDRVDLTNLQRQIAHDTDRIGMNKAESAARRMAAINPEIAIVPLAERLDDGNLRARVAEADVVLDCSDNFATRHAVNRACVELRKPLVSGAAVRFDGQIGVFDMRAPDAPCYACLFPERPGEIDVRCAELGVFAPLVGMIGALQAGEALKLLLPAGRSLSGRLVLYNALDAEWRTVGFGRDPACPRCAGAS